MVVADDAFDETSEGGEACERGGMADAPSRSTTRQGANLPCCPRLDPLSLTALHYRCCSATLGQAPGLMHCH